MITSKEPIVFGGKDTNIKKDKRKFNKNSSFSGVDTRKTTPKSRRKSIAALTNVLPTPLKRKKKVNSLGDWIVSESGTKDPVVKRKQLVIEDSADEENDLKSNASPTKTPKIKTKKKATIQELENGKTIFSPAKVQSSPVKSEKKNRKVEKLTSDSDQSAVEVNEAEERFGIKATNILKAIKSVIKLHSENPKLQNKLFEDRIPLFLQLCCHKVSKGPSRIIRIPLPNSLLTPDDEVCLIVSDVKGIKNIEHEKHLEHYENLLRNKGVENIKKIMTFHEFRTEYETFEQKSRLVDLYDMFLVDAKINGKVVHKCGKIFYKKRKVPTSVKLQATKLKQHIDKALSKAFFFLHLKGNSYNVQFGHGKMQIQDLVDNVYAIVECLNKEFPGGFANIKGLHISAARATSIPIFLSFMDPNRVKTPNILSKKPKAFKTYQDELTTLLNAEVEVHPTGRVIVKRTKNDNKNVSKAVNEIDTVEIEKSTVENGATVKTPRKRKHSENASIKDRKKKVKKTSVQLGENIEVNSNGDMVKQKKKIKKAVKVEEKPQANPKSVVKQEKKKKEDTFNGEKHPELNENIVKQKKKKPKVNENKNVKLQKFENKRKPISGKSKSLTDVRTKEKKNKKVKNQS